MAHYQKIPVLSCDSDNFVNYCLFSELPSSEERGVQGEAVQTRARVEHQSGEHVPAQLLVPGMLELFVLVLDLRMPFHFQV